MREIRALSTKELGDCAEQIALDYLLEKGFILLERNWRRGHLEIDLIMCKDEILHIVEVRSLQAPVLKQPFETVGRDKQKRLVKAADSYVRKNKICSEVVFDIVSVVFEKIGYKIDYLPEAFYPFMIY